ncbi:MAG TPA: HAD family phosphatase [Candidatus Limnocylindrales bacterium]
MTSIKAVLFDLDGVLVDTEIWWDEARLAFAASQGRAWTEADRAAIMGSNTRQWRALMRDRLGLAIPEEDIERAVIGAMLTRYADEGPPVIGDAVSVVRRLAQRYSLAVASSAPPQIIEAALLGMGLRDAFAAVASSDEVPFGKPAPDVYLLAARRLGVAPAVCLVVEDSLNGVLAARAASMPVVLIPNASIQPAPGAREAATFELASLNDLDPEQLAQA